MSRHHNMLILFCCLFLSINLIAQDEQKLSGFIYNDRNEPVSDVSVSVPGAGAPVYTNKEGAFSINLVASESWVLVQPVADYKTQQIYISNQDSVLIYLSAIDVNSGSDMVALPVLNKQRNDMIASFNTMDVNGMAESNYESVDQYLQGKVAGAYVVSNSGMPGSGASVYLRAYSAIHGNNQPLYVVDGIPFEDISLYNEIIDGFNFNPINSIDPLDITDITVLKDAAATAIYGSKGANGVIYIETLKPKETTTTIDVTLRSGLGLVPSQLPQLNAAHYKNLANESLFSGGNNEEKYKLEYPGLFYYSDEEENLKYNHDYNWQDEIFSPALMQNMHVSIKGGDAIAKYGLSISYLNKEGVFSNTMYDRLNVRLVGAFGIFDWLKMNITANLTTTNNSLKESALSPVSSPIIAALAKSPMLNPYEYDSEGNLLEIIDEVEELGTSNPTAVSELLGANAKSYRFITKIGLDGDIADNLKFTSQLGINSNNIKEYLFIPDQGFDLMYNNEVERVSKGQNSFLNSFYNDNKVYYTNKPFSSAHEITAALGFRWQTNQYQQDWGIAKNSPSDEYTELDLGDNVLNDLGGDNRNWNWASVYTNVNYALKDKYLLTATVTSDMSTRIGRDASGTIKIGNVPFGMYYAIGGAWRISNEDFLKNNTSIQELKLRASYGMAGNDDIGELSAIPNYRVDQYREVSVLVPGASANSQLGYQNKNQLNVGVDAGLWANRLRASANFFMNNSKNLLIYEEQNPYLGIDAQPTNNAAFQTTGVEFDAFYRAVNQKDLKLDIGFNISSYKTVVSEIAGGEIVMDMPGEMQIIYREGEQVNSYYGYKYLGVYSTAAEAETAGLYNDKGLKFEAGDAIFENVADENGEYDQKIDDNDKQLLGSFEPSFFGGISLNLKYKRWSVETFFQGVYGNELYNYVRYQNEKMTDLSNQSVKVLQRWQYEGQQTRIPKATWNDPMGNNSFSDRWIEDGSYLRLKQLTLAYTIPDKVLFFNNLKVFVTANNLFTLSPYLGYDPEFSYTPELGVQGADFGLMPMYKQFMIGVKVGL